MKITLLLFFFFVSGCSSVTKNVVLASDGKPQTDVIFYRPSAFPAAANDMLVGFNQKYFAALRNNQYIKIRIDSGTYDFQVKANGSQASNLKLTLKPDQKVCIKSNINPAVGGVALVPLVANMVSWFQLEEVPCPDEKFFAEYSEVLKL
jgi:hypothetical protein